MLSFDWQKPFRTADGRKAELYREHFISLNPRRLDMIVYIWETDEFGGKAINPYSYFKDSGFPMAHNFNGAWNLVNIDNEEL